MIHARFGQPMLGIFSHDGSQDLHLKVDPHFAPYDEQGSAGHPKKATGGTQQQEELKIGCVYCIYIYIKGPVIESLRKIISLPLRMLKVNMMWAKLFFWDATVQLRLVQRRRHI